MSAVTQDLLQKVVENGQEANTHLKFIGEKGSHLELRSCYHSYDGERVCWRECKQNLTYFKVEIWLQEREKQEAMKFFPQHVQTPEMQKFIEDVEKEQITKQDLLIKIRIIVSKTNLK